MLAQCGYYSPWAMYFALDFLADAEPRVPVGAPLTHAKDWWVDSRWMPNMFRDYFVRCAGQGDEATFGPTLLQSGVSPYDTIRKFLGQITHPFVAPLIHELDALRLTATPTASAAPARPASGARTRWAPKPEISRIGARRQGAQAGDRGHRRGAAAEQCGAALSRGAAAGA